MIKLFWLLVAAILLIAFIIIVQPAPETALETTAPEATALIDSLQKTVDRMEKAEICRQQLILTALSAGQCQPSQDWLAMAGDIFSKTCSTANEIAFPLCNKLEKINLPTSAQKRISELKSRVNEFISPMVERDYLLAKKELKLPVLAREWEALAEEFSHYQDSFQRNSALSALGSAVASFDPNLADKIYQKLDAPFFIDRYSSTKCSSEKSEGLKIKRQSGEIDPVIYFESILTCALKENCPCGKRTVFEALNAISDSLSRAYRAARALEKLPALTEDEAHRLLNMAGPAGPMLEAKCWINLILKGGMKPEMEQETLNRLKELIPLIKEDYPRSEVQAWIAYLTSRKDLNEGLRLAEEIETESLRETVLYHITLNHPNLPDKEFESLTSLLLDPTDRILCTLKRLEVLPATAAEQAEMLENISGLVENVTSPAPKIKLLEAWAKIDPIKAEEGLKCLNSDKEIVQALIELARIWKQTASDRARKLIEDRFQQIYFSPNIEDLDKAELLRGLGEAMKIIDPPRAMKIFIATTETLM